ncbi:MAG: hypothetical protein IT360_10310 [Gemmatimonadaceae bacterium]|nr:hypothetical protein [Gemmatimonadaceae bacterium]
MADSAMAMVVGGLLAILAACGGDDGSSGGLEVLTPVVAEIALPTTTSVPGRNPSADSLVFSPPVTDELPIGPTSLAVTDDGSIFVVDPLQESVVLFSADGRLRSRIHVGFAADRLALVRGVLWVQRANDGVAFEVTGDGAVRMVAGGAPFSTDSTLLDSGGDVRFISALETLRLDAPTAPGRLMSARWIATDQDSTRWIAYEFVREDSLVSVTTVIAKHGRDGRRLGEAAFDHPDVDIPPVDEFATRNGMIYQLLPSRLGTRIRVKRVGAGA